MPAIALVDLDSTLADYDAAICRDMVKIASSNELPYIPHAHNCPAYIKAREDVIRRQPGWWLGLKPITASFEVLKLLQRNDFCIHILTKGPATKPLAWKEKVEWVNKYVPYADITITQDKGLVYGRILFDDFPEYCLRWLRWRPRGLVIMPIHNGNKDFSHPNVIKFDGQITDELVSRIAWARDRKAE